MPHWSAAAFRTEIERLKKCGDIHCPDSWAVFIDNCAATDNLSNRFYQRAHASLLVPNTGVFDPSGLTYSWRLSFRTIGLTLTNKLLRMLRDDRRTTAMLINAQALFNENPHRYSIEAHETFIEALYEHAGDCAASTEDSDILASCAASSIASALTMTYDSTGAGLIEAVEECANAYVCAANMLGRPLSNIYEKNWRLLVEMCAEQVIHDYYGDDEFCFSAPMMVG